MNALERNDANDKLSEGIKSGWFVNERKWEGVQKGMQLFQEDKNVQYSLMKNTQRTFGFVLSLALFFASPFYLYIYI